MDEGSESTGGLEQRRYLLLDDRIVEDTQNAESTLGIVNKYSANPLFGEDEPWEMRFDNLYANVIYDDEEYLYKCWYSPFIVDNSSKGMSPQQRQEVIYRAPRNREMAICYATSRDGLTWVKPKLGLVEYDGSKPTIFCGEAAETPGHFGRGLMAQGFSRTSRIRIRLVVTKRFSSPRSSPWRSLPTAFIGNRP